MWWLDSSARLRLRRATWWAFGSSSERTHELDNSTRYRKSWRRSPSCSHSPSLADRSACHVTNCTGKSGRSRWGQSQENSASADAVWQESAFDLTFRFLHAAIGPNSRRVNPHPRFLCLRRLSSSFRNPDCYSPLTRRRAQGPDVMALMRVGPHRLFLVEGNVRP